MDAASPAPPERRSIRQSDTSPPQPFPPQSLAIDAAASAAPERPPSPPPSQPPLFNKDTHYVNYKRRMDRVRTAALGYVAMQGMIWFLGVCNLTWASAVILGGLLTNLSESDYYAVTVLLVAEAVRLGLANSFARLAIARLPSLPSDPSRLIYKPHYTSGVPILNLTKYATQSVLLLLIAASFLLPIRRLSRLPFHEPVLYRSLIVFYSLVLLNATISCITIAYTNTISTFVADSYSLRRFFNFVAWSALDQGLLSSSSSSSFDSISFAFLLLTNDFRRNVRPPTVYSTHKDLLDFLYSHPHMKGFEAAAAALESDDVYFRQAAANAVGSWAKLEEHHGGVALLLQRRLLASLAAALDHNETGRAASYAFEIMARTSPKSAAMLARFRSNANEEVALVEILIWRVREAVEVGKPDKAIIFLKVLLHLIPAEMESGRLPESMWEMLRKDLESIFYDEKSLLRTVAVAGKALWVLKRRGGMDGVKMKNRLKSATDKLRRLKKKKNEHMLEEELLMVCDVMGKNFNDRRSVMKYFGWDEHDDGEAILEIRPVLSDVHDVGRLSPLPDLVFVTVAFSVTLAICFVIDQFL